MRVFWYQGGLHIEPANESEMGILAAFAKSLKFEGPSEAVAANDGPPVLGGQEILELLIGNHQSTKCGFRGDQPINKHTVIPIDKAKQIIRKA